jgi:hypothetical protein
MMKKLRRHQHRREVVVPTLEEHEVVQLKIEITTKLQSMTKTKIGRCPPKTKHKKAVGKSTKGLHQVHQLNQSNKARQSQVSSNNNSNPRFRKIPKKQTRVLLTKFLPKSRRWLERMTLPNPSNTRSTRPYLP